MKRKDVIGLLHRSLLEVVAYILVARPLAKGSHKKVLFLMAKSLRGGGGGVKGRLLRKNNLFLTFFYCPSKKVLYYSR